MEGDSPRASAGAASSLAPGQRRAPLPRRIDPGVRAEDRFGAAHADDELRGNAGDRESSTSATLCPRQVAEKGTRTLNAETALLRSLIQGSTGHGSRIESFTGRGSRRFSTGRGSRGLRGDSQQDADHADHADSSRDADRADHADSQQDADHADHPDSQRGADRADHGDLTGRERGSPRFSTGRGSRGSLWCSQRRRSQRGSLRYSRDRC